MLQEEMRVDGLHQFAGSSSISPYRDRARLCFWPSRSVLGWEAPPRKAVLPALPLKRRRRHRRLQSRPARLEPSRSAARLRSGDNRRLGRSTTCTALSVNVEVEIAGGSGDALMVEDALRPSAGVCRWQRLPHDTYSIKMASLPDGYTPALAAGDAAAAPEEIGDYRDQLTLYSGESSPTITVDPIP